MNRSLGEASWVAPHCHLKIACPAITRPTSPAGPTFLAASLAITHQQSLVPFETSLAIGGALTLALARCPQKVRVSVRNRQVRRRTAGFGAIAGPAAFGFLLGLGWWMFVVSPLFLVRLITTPLTGKALLGACLFGVTRSWTAWYGALFPGHAGNAARTVRTIAFRFAHRMRLRCVVVGGLAAVIA